MSSITFMRDLPYQVLSDDATEPGHLADLITGTLMLNGWRLDQPIGPEGMRVTRGSTAINIDRLVSGLYRQCYSLEQWKQTCAAAGIADVPLQIPNRMPAEQDENASRSRRASDSAQVQIPERVRDAEFEARHWLALSASARRPSQLRSMCAMRRTTANKFLRPNESILGELSAN